MNRSMRLTRHLTRAGYSLIEVLLAVALLGVLAYQVFTVISVASRSTTTDTTGMVLEDHALTVMQSIANAIMGTNRDTLEPALGAPLSSDDINYRIQLGIEDGEVIWEDPERIALDDSDSRVFWSQNPDTDEERRVFWTSLVAPFLEGELLNGVDDNGNGLVDEKGLSFSIDRKAVTVRLTLEERTREGEIVTRTLERTVTCRNPQGETP